MRLGLLRIYDYKCFREAGPIRFEAGFNVIVGSNSSGKTALLEALASAGFKNDYHRSSTRTASLPPPTPRVELDIVVTGAELKAAIQRSAKGIRIPVPPDINSNGKALAYLQDALLDDRSESQYAFQRVAGAQWASRQWPSHGLFKRTSATRSIRIAMQPDGRIVAIDSVSTNDGDDLGGLVAQHIVPTIFVFRAERLNIGKSLIVPEVVLSPDASNLPSALHMLQTRNPHQFDRLNKLVRQVLPTIERITVVPVSGNEVEIRVWSSGYALEREDLAIPMSSCGTGVGQVLAILFLAITSREPRTIVIDEPSSFLHPSAARELLEVLRSEGSHQYILSTHAPEVIASAAPKTLTVLKWNGKESEAITYDGAVVQSTRMALQEVGARLSDVFGLENVIWVEGPTEAACFPMIVAAKRGRMPPSIAFVPIVNTGDLTRKGNHGRLIGQIYRRLSEHSVLMPQTVRISLDREERTEEQQRELSTMMENKVSFLPRRALENYLLHPIAIAYVLQSELPDHPTASAEQVQEWIDAHSSDAKYRSNWTGVDPLANCEWLTRVDAPRLLADLFEDLTHFKLEYRKVEHSSAILKWLLANDLGSAADLSAYVLALVDHVSPL